MVQFSPSRALESRFWGFAPTPAIPKIDFDIEFLENLDFQKYRLDMESEAETCANRLSVQSYVGHAPQVFGPILPLDKVMVRKPDF